MNEEPKDIYVTATTWPVSFGGEARLRKKRFRLEVPRSEGAFYELIQREKDANRISLLCQLTAETTLLKKGFIRID